MHARPGCSSRLPTAGSCSTTSSASNAAPVTRCATPKARSSGPTQTVVRALSTGTADRAQRVIVAALSWSWRSVTVDPLTGEVGADLRGSGPSQADLAALEHALQLAEHWPAKVVAATVGPPAADAQLRDALAAGAAEALRVELGGQAPAAEPARLIGGDPAPAAALAAALLRHYGPPDLVLCGDRTADRGTGSFPAFLAAKLGAQQSLGA